MSISTEIARLQQAKSDLATSITNKGVTVPAATTIDGYAALVDQIQQGGGTLPYDAEIEYLKGDGNAYINTGVVPSSDIRLTVDGWFSVTSGSNLCFGAIQSDSYPRFHLGINGSNFQGGVGDGKVGTTRATSTHRYNFIIDGRDAKAYTTSGGTTGSFTGNSAYPTIPIFLFARNFDGAASNIHVFSLCSAHIYSYSTGKMLVDFIPVRVGTTGYLYDKVSKTLFGNAGSGAFVLGPDRT